MIIKVSVLSDDMLLDCYNIVSYFMGKINHFDFWIQDKVNSGRGVMFADIQDNRLNGFVIGRVCGTSAYVDDLFVLSELHRSGVGTALLNAYQDYVVKSGGTMISLMSRNTVQAFDFYKKAGFTRLGQSNKMQKML